MATRDRDWIMRASQSLLRNVPATVFGRMVREARVAQSYSQEELSRVVGCSRGYISRIESGQRDPSRRIAARIAWVLSGNPWHFMIAAGYLPFPVLKVPVERLAAALFDLVEDEQGEQERAARTD